MLTLHNKAAVFLKDGETIANEGVAGGAGFRILPGVVVLGGIVFPPIGDVIPIVVQRYPQHLLGIASNRFVDSRLQFPYRCIVQHPHREVHVA